MPHYNIFSMEEYRSGHNEPDSKSGVRKRTVGSNPTSSAMSLFASQVMQQAFNIYCCFFAHILLTATCLRFQIAITSLHYMT